MADRLVTHVFRDSKGVTRAIGNLESDWYQRRSEWAIRDIWEDRHRYFVPGRRSPNRPIDVVNGPFGPYLRSRADANEGNNLDELPPFEPRAWEVAHHDSEVLAVHAALIPHGTIGQVLMLGGNEHEFGNNVDNTRVYDVAENRVLGAPSPPNDAFCCEHAFLPDGRLMIAGGTDEWQAAHAVLPLDQHDDPHDHWSGARDCAAYNADGSWTPLAPLLPEPGRTTGGGRWYPTLVTLGNGEVLAVGGHPLLADTRHGAWLPERYDPIADTWSYQPGHWLYTVWSHVPDSTPTPPGQSRSGDDNYLYYPRPFVVPDGRVFMASANDGNCGWYNIETGLVDDPLLDPPAHGAGFAETNHTAVLLPLLPAENYRPRVLFFGNQGPRVITLDESPQATPPAWIPTAPRDWPDEPTPEWAADLVGSETALWPPRRRHGCATLLPTGDVLFTGGINAEGATPLPDSRAVRDAEVYSCGFDWANGVIDRTRERWTTTGRAAVVRNYHSVALLLPNGRVFTAGSNLNGANGEDEVKEYRIEIFCPDYDGDRNRPVIHDAPANLSYGETFTFNITSAARIQRVALLRCGSVTHAWDGDQRYVGLTFQLPEQGTSITAVAPPNGNVAPPGPYMLWVVDRRSRPCRLARFVLLS